MQTILLWFYSHKWPLHVSDMLETNRQTVHMTTHQLRRTTATTPRALHHMRQWYNLVYKNSWRWTCKCPKHVEAIYENKNHSKIVCIKLVHLLTYTGCHRRNGPNFGRVFLMLNYTDITQNTYIQSWRVMEIMAIEKCGLLWCPGTVSRPWRHIHPMRMPGNEKPLANLECIDVGEITLSCCLHQLFGNLRTNTTVVRVFL